MLSVIFYEKFTNSEPRVIELLRLGIGTLITPLMMLLYFVLFVDLTQNSFLYVIYHIPSSTSDLIHVFDQGGTATWTLAVSSIGPRELCLARHQRALSSLHFNKGAPLLLYFRPQIVGENWDVKIKHLVIEMFNTMINSHFTINIVENVIKIALNHKINVYGICVKRGNLSNICCF